MATGGFVKRGEQEDPLGAAGTDKITRIFPIDTYDFPPELLSLAVRYHFLRVPMLGQYNPIAKKDDWCGRTAASITWNYYQRAIARIADKSQYIAHWRGPGSAQMGLRYPISGNLAFVNQSGTSTLFEQRASPGTPSPSLEAGLVGWGLVQFPALFGDNLKQSLENPTAFSGVVPPEKRPPRLAEAEAIRKDPEKLRQVLKPVFDALSRNNPVVLNTGLSKDSAYGGHLILVVGFCDLPDDEHGTVWPWLLVANPAPPEIDEGPRCTPATNLRQLHEGKDSIYFVGNPGDWWHAQGYLHLMRASKLFEQNINPQRTHENALWIDDLYNPGRWGGQFLSRKEATPLDPDLVVTKGVVPSLSFPIQDETWAHPDPISYYRLAESAGRGFYPLGVNRLLHGGAHFVGDGSQIIRSMAPGYVVAARIGNARPDKRVNDFVENETGFVLVRHDLELPSAGSLAFYSLYMHLRPTKWPVDKDNAYEEVHWLRRFYLSFYGGIVNLDPNRGPVGQIRWAAANVPTPIPESCKVYAADGKLNVADRFALRAGTRCVGYFKGSGGNLRKGWDALSSHAVVTFSGPLLQVAHGEPLGVTQSDRGNGISGSLHWEVFARADQSPNAVEKMVDLATKELKLAMDPSSPSGTPPPFSISQSDNVLHADKLKAIGAKLLADDPKRFEAEVLEAAKLQGEIDQAAPPANAASQNQALDTLKEKTGVRTLTVDNAYEQLLDRFMATSTFAAAPASSPVNPDVKQPAYSVTLQIDVTTYPVTATSGGAEIKIAFLSAAKAILGTASKPLTQAELQTKNPIRISLMVPAETATLEVKSRFHLDHVAAPGADKDLAAIVLPARFRGLSIEHVTEWSEASLHDLVQHRFQAGS